MYVAVLGRQAELSLAELESVIDPESISRIGDDVAVLDVSDPLDIDRLGGTIKLAKVLTKLENTNLDAAFNYLQKTIPQHLDQLPKGKLKFGVSVYGFAPKSKWLLRQMLGLKKTIRSEGRSVRIIQNNEPALGSAQVLYNKLTDDLGWELLLIKDGSDIILAQTIAVQNIDNYAKRDQERPARDAKVGMLPPKLAQIMINLAKPDDGAVVFDLYCGTGVVLQEAHLMNFGIAGSDLEPRMVEYSQKNLVWLDESLSDVDVQTADATEVKLPNDIGAIVSEMYLGQPLHKPPANKHLDELLQENYQLLTETLENLAPQLKTSTPLCIAIPAWRQTTGITSVLNDMLTVDHLKKLGYTRKTFKFAKPTDLIYAREDQIVGRQLLVLRRD